MARLMSRCRLLDCEQPETDVPVSAASDGFEPALTSSTALSRQVELRARAVMQIKVVTDSLELPEWLCRSVEHLQQQRRVQIFEVQQAFSFQQADSDKTRLLSKLVHRFGRWFFGRGEDPTRKRPMATYPRCELKNDPDGRVTMLVLGDISSALLDQTVDRWSFEFGRGGWLDPDIAAEDAVLSGSPVIEARIVERRSDVASRIVARSVTGTVKHSVRKTRDRMLWAAVSLPISAAESPVDAATLPSVTDSIAATTIPLMHSPASVARLGLQIVKDAATWIIAETDWIIGISASPDEFDAEHASADSLKGVSVLASPPDRFWADPFPVTLDDTTWLFVEEWLRGKPHAHLATMEIRHDGSVGPSTPVLQRPYHLSYPHVFSWMDEHYMIPETRSNHTVELYKSYDFPHDWRLEHVLLQDIAAVDATVFEDQGRWWMFVGVAPKHGVENDQLHLYSAETPLGPWRPHPMNPVVSDVRSARPAGRVFRDATGLVRPSQNCARRYGYAVAFNRIRCLTEDRYEEELISTILPTWTPGIEGTHTFNMTSNQNSMFIDGARKRFRFRRWA